MLKLLMVWALCFAALMGFAQNRLIKGRIVDSVSNKPVESARIALSISRDSIWIPVAHALSDDKGGFTFIEVPRAEQLKITVTFIAYSVFEKAFKAERRGEIDMGVIRIDPKSLTEVQVKEDQQAITMHDDTVAFNGASYETPPNSSVEELMRKLPGIEIDIDGTIYYNGREIKKIRLDGHEFFSDNYRIASKGLDVDMIEQIRVYDDRDEDPDHDIPSYETDKIIDIRLKKAFRNSMFGKAFGGGGNRSRNAMGALGIVPHNNLQVSSFFQANNLSNTGFSTLSVNDDANLSEDNVPAINSATVASSISNAGSLGVKKILTGGINGNIENKAKLKLNLSYRYDQAYTDFDNTLTRRQLADNVGVNSNSSTIKNQRNSSHFVNGLLTWRPNTSKLIIYEPRLTITDNGNVTNSLSDNSNTDAKRVSTSINKSDDGSKSVQFRHSLRYYTRFSSGNSININHTLVLFPQSSRLFNLNSLKSFTNNLTTTTLDRFTNTFANRRAADLTARYRHPVNDKLTGFIEIGTRYAHNQTERSTYNYNAPTALYDIFLQALSNNLIRNEYTQTVSPGITYNFTKKVILGFNANTELTYVNNRFDRGYADINHRYVNFLPNLYIRVGKAYLGLRSTFSLPGIADMVPYDLSFNQLRTVKGNPSLKPVTANRINFRYTTYTNSQLSLHTESILTLERNSIFRTTTLNSVGVSTNAPTNMNGRFIFTTNTGVSKRFKMSDNFQVTSTSGLYFGKSKGFFEVNNQGAYQNTANFSMLQSFRFYWKKLLELEQGGKINHLKVTYTGVNYDAISNTGLTMNTHLTVYGIKYIIVEGSYDHIYNGWVAAGERKNADVLSFSITRQLSKNSHNEFRISCFDILNQNVSYMRAVNANTLTDTRSAVLNRYFLASLMFKLNKPATQKPH